MVPPTFTRGQLLKILAIAHDTSMRGEGLSLRDALRRADYRAIRPSFGPADLVPLIRERPELVEQWRMWCEDKRTDGGFAIEGDSAKQVAEYVVRELDYWART